MVDLITSYLLNKGHLSLKGIGTFQLKSIPARLDFPNRLLHAPQTELEFSVLSSGDEGFIEWLQGKLQISAEKIKQQLDIFLQQFHQQISNSNSVEWKGIGSFIKTENNVLQFQPLFEIFTGDPVKAERIIRKDAEHVVRVGEDEKTSKEMEELLSVRSKRKIQMWWIAALVLFLLGIAAVWFYASTNENWKNQGNDQPVKTERSEPTYKLQ